MEVVSINQTYNNASTKIEQKIKIKKPSSVPKKILAESTDKSISTLVPLPNANTIFDFDDDPIFYTWWSHIDVNAAERNIKTFEDSCAVKYLSEFQNNVDPYYMNGLMMPFVGIEEFHTPDFGDGNIISQLSNTYSSLYKNIQEEFADKDDEKQRALDVLDKLYNSIATTVSSKFATVATYNFFDRATNTLLDISFVKIKENFDTVLNKDDFRAHLKNMATKAAEFVKEHGRAPTDKELDAYSGADSSEKFENMTMAEITYLTKFLSGTHESIKEADVSENFKNHMEKAVTQNNIMKSIYSFLEESAEEYMNGIAKEYRKILAKIRTTIDKHNESMRLSANEIIREHFKQYQLINDLTEQKKKYEKQINEFLSRNEKVLYENEEIALGLDRLKRINDVINGKSNEKIDYSEELTPHKQGDDPFA